MHDRVLKCFVRFFRRRSLEDNHHGVRAFLRTCKGRTESDEDMKAALGLFYADEYWNVTQLSLNACALELLQVLAAETLQCTVYVAEDTNGVPDRLARVVRMFSPFVRDRLAENANLRQYEDSVYFSQLDIGERGVIGGIDRDPNSEGVLIVHSGHHFNALRLDETTVQEARGPAGRSAGEPGERHHLAAVSVVSSHLRPHRTVVHVRLQRIPRGLHLRPQELQFMSDCSVLFVGCTCVR